MTTLSLPLQARGVGYPLWLRGRWPLVAALAVLLGLAYCANFVPELVERQPYGMPKLILLIVPVALFPLLALLNVFTYGPIDLNSKASQFPTHPRLLPMSTRALVGWPMLFGVVTIVSLWLLLDLLVLSPSGFATGVIWPATILAACTVWFQAMAWVPCPWRFVRMPLILLAVGVPIGFATMDPRKGDSFWTFVAGMVLWTALGYATATFGLSRARTGAEFGAFGAASRNRAAAMVPFRSATAARVWYEFRRNSSFFLKAFGFLAVPLVLFSILTVAYPRAIWSVRLGPQRIPLTSLFSAIYLIFGPLFISAASGGYIGRFDFWNKQGFSPFFAVRPVTSARLVGDKLISAVFATAGIMVWSLVIAGFAYWGFFANAPASVRVDWSGIDVVLVIAAYAFVVWRNLVVGMWSTMGGRAWLSAVVATLGAFVFFAVPGIFGWFVSHAQERRAVLETAPFIGAGVLGLKLAASGAMARSLVRRALITSRTALTFALGWCALVALAFATTYRLDLLSWRTAFFIAAVVPCARLGLAVRALDANRHG